MRVHHFQLLGGLFFLGSITTSLASPLRHRDSDSLQQSHILTIAHQKRGLLTVAFDPSSDDEPLKIIRTTQAGVRPNWLCGTGENLYSIARTGYPDGETEEGGIFAFKTNCSSRKLRHIGDVSTLGEGGCHCDVSPGGDMLSVANIDGSSVTLHPRFPNGTIGEASHTFTYTLASPGPGHDGSQIQPNPHQTVFSPSGNLMLVPDRGADLVYVYRVHAASGDVKRLEDISLSPGSGPRHASFWSISETQSLMILLGELDNTLRVYSIVEDSASNDENVNITLLQTVSTLGADLDPTSPDGATLAAEVAISPDGRFVYASNRDTTSLENDFLAIFSLDTSNISSSSPANARNGTAQPLTWVGHNDTQGKLPRHFSIGGGEDNGGYIAVLNQVSNDLQVFARDVERGLLSEKIGSLVFGELTMDTDVGPIAVKWD